MTSREELEVLVAAARVDGSIEPAERRALDAVAAEMGLGAVDVDAIIGDAPTALRLPKEAAARERLFERLCAVVTADGVVREQERALLRRVGERLGVGPDVLEARLAPAVPPRRRWTGRCLGCLGLLVVGAALVPLGLLALLRAVTPEPLPASPPPTPPPVWALLLEGTDDACAAAAPDGGLFVAGTYLSGLSVNDGRGARDLLGRLRRDEPRSPPEREAQEGFLLRVAADGSIAWARGLGRFSWARDLTVTSTGQVVLVGDVTGRATLGEGTASTTLACVDSGDAFVAGFGPARGDLAWARPLVTPLRDVGRVVLARPDGGVVVAGRSLSWSITPERKIVFSTFDRPDATFARELDGAGAPGWEATLEGTSPHGNDQSDTNALALLQDGSLLWGGWLRGGLRRPACPFLGDDRWHDRFHSDPSEDGSGGWLLAHGPDRAARWATQLALVDGLDADVHAIVPDGDGAVVLTNSPEGVRIEDGVVWKREDIVAAMREGELEPDVVLFALGPDGRVRWRLRVWTAMNAGHFQGCSQAGTLAAAPGGGVYLQGGVGPEAYLDERDALPRRQIRLGGRGLWIEDGYPLSNRGWALESARPALYVARVGPDGIVRWAGAVAHGFYGFGGEGDLLRHGDGSLTLVKAVAMADLSRFTEDVVTRVTVPLADRELDLGTPHARSALIVRLSPEH